MAETDLAALIRGMSPVLAPEIYVFATTPAPPDIPALMRFEEAEGVTLIVARDAAEAAGLAYEFPCRMITLNVHSALEAVGFIAAVARALAAAAIGANPVAGFHHDHLFVAEDRAEDAMRALAALAESGAPH